MARWIWRLLCLLANTVNAPCIFLADGVLSVWALAFVLFVYMIVSRLMHPELGLSNRPPFYIVLTAMIIGSQLFLSGFIGEMISRNSPNRNAYLIEAKTGIECKPRT